MRTDEGIGSSIPTVVSQEQQVEAPQKQFVLPTRFVGSIKKLAFTPSVMNCERWKCQNDAPTTIVNFLDGADGQTLHLLGDGFTTIANNTTINTNTGTAKLLLANRVYTFTYFNSVWTEHLS